VWCNSRSIPPGSPLTGSPADLGTGAIGRACHYSYRTEQWKSIVRFFRRQLDEARKWADRDAKVSWEGIGNDKLTARLHPQHVPVMPFQSIAQVRESSASDRPYAGSLYPKRASAVFNLASSASSLLVQNSRSGYGFRTRSALCVDPEQQIRPVDSGRVPGSRRGLLLKTRLACIRSMPPGPALTGFPAERT